jgi:dihydroxyacetone kinase-like predicted kinase
VTIAARQAITTAGPCEPGDILGAIEGDFAIVGHHLAEVAVKLLDRLISGGGAELVTLVTGEGGQGLAEHCEEYIARKYPIIDVVIYDGGQVRYPLLLSVE